MEENKFENKIATDTFEQLCYQRAILLEQEGTIRKNLKLIDEEIKKRLRS